MPTLELNPRSIISPLGIVRLFEIFLSCTAFSLVAVHHSYDGAEGAWSMFTWCFCFTISVFIVIVELLGLAESLPLSWQDFTSAFSMLAALMVFTTSILYPSIFISKKCRSTKCSYEGAATAMSCLCFIAYAIEVGLTRAKARELGSFLATIPGLLKVFEIYVACIIFSLVGGTGGYYAVWPGLQRCLAVYCICFIITLLIVILTIGRCLASLPFPLEKALVGYNIWAVALYVTAVIVWPIYSFKLITRPYPCTMDNFYCIRWNNLLGVTFLTFFNLIAYIVDLVYSSKMVLVTMPA
ncbi:myeloid-associated differentiation marker-like [Rhineura floridana]|uniref:myeloid-associated differentiation marker-like n=1 Tax=Rhineura floridana TaxID=261503 RepID=UPI002AC80370|nr:myeloid-associated differentiation marker-like [Rhineura floridana]